MKISLKLLKAGNMRDIFLFILKQRKSGTRKKKLLKMTMYLVMKKQKNMCRGLIDYG